ncbi:MAG: rRNA maturation RNase YbeY [Eubacteriales bacterium]
MTIHIEKIIEIPFEIEYNSIVKRVIKEVLIEEEIESDVEINVLLVDNEFIKCLNMEHRGKNYPTDVLSFPIIDYAQIGDIKTLDDHKVHHFNMETEELILGDIVISIEKLKEQALLYGHSKERELGFLVAHSMLHLLGYNHMEPEEEDTMKIKQKQILQKVGLIR